MAGLGDVTEGANLTSGGPAGRLLPFLQVKGEGDLGYLLAAEVKTGQQGPTHKGGKRRQTIWDRIRKQNNQLTPLPMAMTIPSISLEL